MTEAIGQVLSLGLGVALSPIPVIAVVLMLGTPRARTNGPAFVLGWVLGLVVVGTVVLLLAGAGGASEDAEPAAWVDWLKIVLGALLVLLGLRQWRGRPRDPGAGGDLPGWMRGVDHFTPTRSVAMGAALSGVNPKNLILTTSAAATIAQSATTAGDEAVAMAVFVAIGTLGCGGPVALYFALGERATRLLEGLRAWMAAHSTAIMAVLCLVIGAKLIGDGIAGL